MNNYAQFVKNNLENIIDELEMKSESYLENPEKNFTRNRKLTFKEVVKIILSTGGKTLNNELLEYFSFDCNLPTASAFVQQRGKISFKAFKYIYEKFTEYTLKGNKNNSYRLLAIDGSDLIIAHNPLDKKTYFPNGNSKGFNALHLNAIYDLDNKIFTDVTIQNGREANERKALIEMSKRLKDSQRAILIADRGYESYNIMEHIKQNGQYFLIRAKDIASNGIASGLNLPKEDILDEDINLLLTRRYTKEIKANLNKYKFMPQNQNFDFLLPKSKSTYPISFRIVRVPIGKNRYEVLITNLSRDEFPVEKLKEMYHLRWGIETGFRELKHAIGLTSFHSKKVEYIKQEIYAKLTMYNFCETITANVVLQKKKTKHDYQVNFTAAISICLQYFKQRFDIAAINVEALIQRYILPVRKGRKDPRKVKPKSTVSFTYRVA